MPSTSSHIEQGLRTPFLFLWDSQGVCWWPLRNLALLHRSGEWALYKLHGAMYPVLPLFSLLSELSMRRANWSMCVLIWIALQSNSVIGGLQSCIADLLLKCQSPGCFANQRFYSQLVSFKLTCLSLHWTVDYFSQPNVTAPALSHERGGVSQTLTHTQKCLICHYCPVCMELNEVG